MNQINPFEKPESDDDPKTAQSRTLTLAVIMIFVVLVIMILGGFVSFLLMSA